MRNAVLTYTVCGFLVFPALVGAESPAPSAGINARYTLSEILELGEQRLVRRRRSQWSGACLLYQSTTPGGVVAGGSATEGLRAPFASGPYDRQPRHSRTDPVAACVRRGFRSAAASGSGGHWRIAVFDAAHADRAAEHLRLVRREPPWLSRRWTVKTITAIIKPC